MQNVANPKIGLRHRAKGRHADTHARERIRGLLGAMPRRRDLLIEYLHLVQDAEGHLPAALLTALAKELSLSVVEVYEVASFYHHFDVVNDGETPPPALTVKSCDSISCELAGANELIDALQGVLGDAIRVQRVPCLGRCDRAPVAVVGKNPVDRAKVQRIVSIAESGAVHAPVPEAEDYAAYRASGGYRQLCRIAADETGKYLEQAIGELERSELRGLGGAGFPAGRKWRIVNSYPGPRLMAVNIDEGEPGTFKDRHYLERHPHRFQEGMLIAARAVAAKAVYIYLRDEYTGCRAMLHQELDRLVSNPPCPIPPIHLRRGAGAYVCGEESAMIESIEGKRGMPRLRPPYIAERGLFGLPTLEHNMETLYWVPEILNRGADWFSSQGRYGRKGLRSFSVSGRVTRPGVHLAPAGITVRELIEEYCGGMLAGHRFKAYFPGGASGGILPAWLGDIPLDFDTLQEHGCSIGSAAVIVLSNRDNVRRAALNAMRFFAHESCGQCTPCRVGTEKAARLMAEPAWNRELLEDLAAVMADASICGLGQAAPNPLRCALKYFPEEFE